MGHVTTRADDEAVLEMLRLRRTMPASMIATKFRSSQSAVRITTNRVVRDDSAEEGHDVRGEYGFIDLSDAVRIGMGGQH